MYIIMCIFAQNNIYRAMDELDNAVIIDEYCYSHDIDDYDLYGQIMEGDNDEDNDCDIKFE